MNKTVITKYRITSGLLLELKSLTLKVDKTPTFQLWSIFSITFKVPMTLARAMLILRLISVAELDNEKDGAGTLSKWAFLESKVRIKPLFIGPRSDHSLPMSVTD